MSNYDEIFYTETEQDEMDLAAHEEAYKILSGEIPSSPKTYAMVQKFYGIYDGKRLEQDAGQTQKRVCGNEHNILRDVRAA